MTKKIGETITPMSANIVTILRIVLVFITVGFFTLNAGYAIAAFFLTFIVISMDSLDGYIARKLGVASDFGALLDITGDRIVENTFWIYFAARGDITFWIPIVIVTRGFLVDTVRSLAFSGGKTPFGKKTMMRSRFTQVLVSSPFSRSFYATAKLVAFGCLGGIIALKKGNSSGYWAISSAFISTLFIVTQVIVYATVIMSIIRAIPVIWDGKEFILAKKYPKQFRNEN